MSNSRDSSGDDPVADLRRELATVESKVQFADGIDGIVKRMRDVSSIIERVSDSEIERTREKIRALIDELLELNVQVQSLVRLKRLLS